MELISTFQYSDVSCLQTLTSFLDMRTLMVGEKPASFCFSGFRVRFRVRKYTLFFL